MTTLKSVSIDGDAYGLSDEFLSHVLETAVEGACAYWADIIVPDEAGHAGSGSARDFDVSDHADDDDVADKVDEMDGSAAPRYTSASFAVAKDPTKGGTVDLQDGADAIERIANKEAEVALEIRETIIAAVETGDPSDIDAEAADCIVQIALFDEIVYR